MAFALDQRLADSTIPVMSVAGIQVRLVDDSRYVWLLLVPECEGVEELQDLEKGMRDRLFSLAAELGGWMKTNFEADKINVATIGNLVPQFHLHVVARRRDDAAWPGPVWGHGAPTGLTPARRQQLLTEVAAFLDVGDTV